MRKLCQKCWTAYGKSLWAGCCYCSGSIESPFVPPGTLYFNPPARPDPPKEPKRKAKK